MTYNFVVVLVSNWVHGLHIYYLAYSRLTVPYCCYYSTVEHAPSLTTIGAVTSDGLTPLGLVVRGGKLNTIKYLIIECNMDINGKLVHAIQLYGTE